MKIDNHPLAVNCLKFQYYNFDFFSCQEIVLFETLIVLGGISFKKKEEFFHSTKTLTDKTGIKKHTVDKSIQRFGALGILDVEVKGMPRVKFYKMNWGNIIELLPEIYQFDDFRKQFNESTQPLYDFFHQCAENDQEKNSNKNIDQNNNKENEDNALARVDDIENFKGFLSNSFKYKGSVLGTFNNNDLLKALEVHKMEEIKNAVKSKNDSSFNLTDMRKFFKFNSKGEVIAVVEDIEHKNVAAEKLFNKLNDTLKRHIDIYNNDPSKKRTKVYISLPKSKKELNKLMSSMGSVTEDDLCNAFMVLSDEVIQEVTKVKHGMISYLLKEVDGEYPVLNDYILKFLCGYGKDKY